MKIQNITTHTIHNSVKTEIIIKLITMVYLGVLHGIKKKLETPHGIKNQKLETPHGIKIEKLETPHGIDAASCF